jgi:hypothetical protein
MTGRDREVFARVRAAIGVAVSALTFAIIDAGWDVEPNDGAAARAGRPERKPDEGEHSCGRCGRRNK